MWQFTVHDIPGSSAHVLWIHPDTSEPLQSTYKVQLSRHDLLRLARTVFSVLTPTMQQADLDQARELAVAIAQTAEKSPYAGRLDRIKDGCLTLAAILEAFLNHGELAHAEVDRGKHRTN